MALTTKDSEKFQKVVRDATAQLVSHKYTSGAIYITTPLMYASGGFVVIRIEQASGEFLVSDFGAGHEEAQLMNGEQTYRKVAHRVAEESGVRFDSFAFSVPNVSADQLPGAIATVANASQEAVNITSMKLSERKHKDDNAILFDRLTGVFGKKSVARNVHILGESNTEWRISSLVTADSKRVAFEAVTHNSNSVVHAAVKFSDIARINSALGRVAVVADKKSLGTYLAVLKPQRKRDRA